MTNRATGLSLLGFSVILLLALHFRPDSITTPGTTLFMLLFFLTGAVYLVRRDRASP